MPDLQDMVTSAIQSYTQKFNSPNDPGALVLMAVADDLATHLIDDLRLRQEWGVGTFQKRGSKELLDDIICEDTQRDRALRNVRRMQQTDKAQIGEQDVDFRRALVTYIFRDWEEEATDAELDPALVELVENDL